MNDVNARSGKVTVASRIPAQLAAEITRMAEDGNRTVSREIWAAVAEHVAQQLPSVASAPPLGRPEADERRRLVGPAPEWVRWPARDVTPEDIERLEKLQRLEREGDQAVRR